MNGTYSKVPDWPMITQLATPAMMNSPSSRTRPGTPLWLALLTLS